MAPFDVKQCASCGAAVVWTFTHKGKKMPVDASPVPDGNITLREYKGIVLAEYDGQEHPSLFKDPEQPRYVSHFATCPDSEQWRKHD